MAKSKNHTAHNQSESNHCFYSCLECYFSPLSRVRVLHVSSQSLTGQVTSPCVCGLSPIPSPKSGNFPALVQVIFHMKRFNILSRLNVTVHVTMSSRR